MGRIKPQYLSMSDWFGSAPKQSALVVVAPGGEALVSEVADGTSELITNPTFSLNEAGTELTIAGDNGEDRLDEAGDPNDDFKLRTLAASVTRTDTVIPRGQVGDLRMFRVNLAVEYTESDPPADNDSSGAGANSQAEGELVETESDSGGGLTTEGAGEGELIVAPLTSGDSSDGSEDSTLETDPIAESLTELDVSPMSSDDFVIEDAPSSDPSDTSLDQELDSEDSSSLSPNSVDQFFGGSL